ncbi:unnamed protein product [Hymenolepis diminuta]|nr:unnamed protein product [Hymenolepis diminuta]VUZ52047.1 unnamed protein product [Hymenolepis diminuta]
MEEHRLKRDFALDLDRTKNKYIQFLVLYNHTHDSDVKVASVRLSFRRFISYMENSALDITVQYEFMSAVAFKDGPHPISEIPFGSVQPDYINESSSNQVIQVVLLFVDRSEPFRDWFDNILRSLNIYQGLIIGVYHENEQESFDVINDFVGRRADYERSLLSKLECPWRIWGVRRNEDQSLDLQEMHTWFCEIYRSY